MYIRMDVHWLDGGDNLYISNAVRAGQCHDRRNAVQADLICILVDSSGKRMKPVINIGYR